MLAETISLKDYLTCHNEVPKGLPQPTDNIKKLETQFANSCKNTKCKISGISGNVNASKIPSSTLYAQYQAANSLVPCGEESVSVFVPQTLLPASYNSHDRHSVAVIYTDKSSKYQLKNWLK